METCAIMLFTSSVTETCQPFCFHVFGFTLSPDLCLRTSIVAQNQAVVIYICKHIYIYI